MPAERRTARERARADVMEQILAAGRRELAEHGADGLSLRAVAREVGMVSSAVYRYVASRDDLLTALIIDSYTSVGEAVEQAASARTTPGRAFVRACQAVRTWGREHPQEYALLYGSPVPGYEAPQETIPAASRVPLALSGLIQAAYDAGSLSPNASAPAVPRSLAKQCGVTQEVLGRDLPDEVVLQFVAGWVQIYGFISFELFGQFVATFDPADALAARVFASAATDIGFTDL